ncbi:MAG TPA: ABC transporter permease [Planctomycetota bacterium]|nr:ABC transporter permease [Planctomycetota bacterium]
MNALPRGRILLALARQELRIVLRARWVAAYVVVFAALTLAVSYFGLAVIEVAGFQEFDRTAVSLLNLVLYVVPLAVMLMAVQGFREEGGATDQLFTEPVARTEIVLGKLLGLGAAHTLATLLGFGFTGVLVALKVGTQGLESYLVLVGFTILAGAVFLPLGALLTVLSGRRTRSYAVVLVAWFLMVLLFDLVAIGLAFVLPDAWGNRVAFLCVFLNPADATRVGAMLAISGKETFGPAGAQLVRGLGGEARAVALLVGTLLAWAAATSAGAAAALRRQDLHSGA